MQIVKSKPSLNLSQNVIAVMFEINNVQHQSESKMVKYFAFTEDLPCCSQYIRRSKKKKNYQIISARVYEHARSRRPVSRHSSNRHDPTHAGTLRPWRY